VMVPGDLAKTGSAIEAAGKALTKALRTRGVQTRQALPS
jgi:hypothetical protein